jgi:uncharacterized membrane protein
MRGVFRMSLVRALRHLTARPWLVRRAFPRRTLERIEAAIGASEQSHRGEIRFAVEGALDFLPVARGLTARERALELFSALEIWDTEENTGVLVYVQLVDRSIEIVADRGIAKRIPQIEWDAICARMQQAFVLGHFEEGALVALREIGALLAAHFPCGAQNADELPDRPIVL